MPAGSVDSENFRPLGECSGRPAPGEPQLGELLVDLQVGFHRIRSLLGDDEGAQHPCSWPACCIKGFMGDVGFAAKESAQNPPVLAFT